MGRGRPKTQVSPCRFCNMQFKRHEHLRRHERIHTQEKPFSCGCGQKFSRQDLLSRHVRLSHREPSVETNVETTAVALTGAVRMETPVKNAQDIFTPATETSQASQSTDESPDASNDTLGTLMPIVPSLNTDPPFSLGQDAVGHPTTMESTFDSRMVQRPSHFNAFPPADPAAGLALGSTYEFDMLWNNSSDMTSFLPTAFFDTDYSLSRLWQTDMWTVETNPTAPLTWDSHNRAGQPSMTVGLETSISSLSSRLPPLEPDSLSLNTSRLPTNELGSHRGLDTIGNSMAGLPWNITAPAYEKISSAIMSYKHILPASFVIPSRHTMSRYIEGYFRGFHEHFPFLHPPTLKTDALAPELILALAAVGAFYRFEHAKGYQLYLGSKAIIMHRLQQRSQLSIASLTRRPPDSNFGNQRLDPSTGEDQPRDEVGTTPTLTQADFRTLQSLIILIAMTAWADKPAVREAISMGSQLAVLVREAGLISPDEIIGKCEWLDWVGREERRRTLFVAYILLNISSVAYDAPPMILNREIRLCLPHCNTEWVLTSAAEWRRTRQSYGHTERQFQSTLDEILRGQDVFKEEPLSALGNYVLINALIQYIFIERQTSASPALPPDKVKQFELALQSWQRSWEATQETSLDPSSPNGPLGFDSAALLRLAYLRLNANLGPCRNLMSQDPNSIARACTDEAAPLFTRSSHVDRAVLQCIHALSIPIRVGIAFAACTQTMKGSIQHHLCTLECAFLLSRWLVTISDVVQSSGLVSLREDERKLLGMIACLIRETELANTLDMDASDGFCIRRMAATVVRLWAETFRGPHIFQISRIIGDSLSTLADMLGAQL